MLIEQHPELQQLSAEDKLRLSEELFLDLLLDAKANPDLAETMRERLAEFDAGADAGVRWEDFQQRLLARLGQPKAS